MIPIRLGIDVERNSPVYLQDEQLQTHLHLIGATGTGKTTAVHTLLRPILMNPRRKACLFLIDPMGGLSQDLLLWMSDKRRCPEHVRRRLLYIEPASEEYVMPLNPLLYESQANEYYQVERAVDLVLRAWQSQDLDAMPRLRRWTFNAFFSAARMGFPIAICRFLLMPNTDEHRALLRQLPLELRAEWSEIYAARGGEATRLLDSTRNRLSPFFDSVILRRMFGSRRSLFDVERFVRERRIVIVNVSKGRNRLSSHIGRTIGSLIVNEILDKIHNLSLKESRSVIEPTYLLLDEFQHFVGPDLADAIPVVRQMGLRLILAHQSFAQLLQGDLDLSSIIWQARSRLMFANDADDADLIAHELATMTFDPLKIKHQVYNYQQRIAGYRREWLASNSTSRSIAENWSRQLSAAQNASKSYTHPSLGRPANISSSIGNTNSGAEGAGGNFGIGTSEGSHEQLVPIYEEVRRLAGVTFSSFEEHRVHWAGEVRKLATGLAFGKFRNDPRIYPLAIDHRPLQMSSKIEDQLLALREKNFSSDVFLSSTQVDAEAEAIRREVLQGPPLVLDAKSQTALPSPAEDPFDA